MTYATKYVAWFFLVILLAWAVLRVPDHGFGREGENSFSFVLLVSDTTDPNCMLFGFLGLWIAGWRGARDAVLRFVRRDASRIDHARASRALSGAGRGLLWSACLLGILYVASFYWTDFDHETSLGFADGPERLVYARYVGLVAIPLSALLLIPAAEAVQARAGKRPSFVLRTVDGLALIGVLGSALAVLLMLFVKRAPVIGHPNTGLDYVLPSADGVTMPFILWSLAVILAIVGLTSVSLLPDGLATARLSATSVAAGVLVALLVEVAGFQYIATHGGQGNPAELRSLAGRMLVPAAIGALLGLFAKLAPLGRLENQRQNQARSLQLADARERSAGA